MQSPQFDDSRYIAQRRLPRFTSFTRYHHPCLDPDFPEENISLVPQDLCPRGGLNWDLPCQSQRTEHDELNNLSDTDRLIKGLRTRIFKIENDLDDLERAILTWIGKVDTIGSYRDESSRKDQSSDMTRSERSHSVLSTSNCREESEKAGLTCPTTRVSSSMSNSENRASTVDHAIKYPSGGLLTVNHVHETAVQNLRNNRSFGPYEIFWMENDPHDQGGRREAFSILEPAEE